MTSSITPDDVHFDRKEAAEYLNVSDRTLSNWACSGRYKLPYYRIGRRVLYKKSELDLFMAQGRVGH